MRKNPFASYPDTPIQSAYQFSLLFDVENGNPNGDPDTGGMPRVDPEDQHGYITDVCIKRKIRDAVSLLMEDVDTDKKGYEIYVKDGIPLRRNDMKAIEYVGLDPKALKDAKKSDPDLDLKLRNFMCDNFYDVRTFGAVMTTFTENSLNCGQVKGPVQLCFGRSIDPVFVQEVVITRKAPTRETDDPHGMGRKYMIPYALYRMNGTISASLANHVTGFSERDLALLWEAITKMFEFDRSASRGLMTLRKLVIFKNDSVYGNAPAQNLFNLVQVKKKDDVTVSRSFSDYDVSIGEAPKGVSIEVLG